MSPSLQPAWRCAPPAGYGLRPCRPCSSAAAGRQPRGLSLPPLKDRNSRLGNRKIHHKPVDFTNLESRIPNPGFYEARLPVSKLVTMLEARSSAMTVTATERDPRFVKTAFNCYSHFAFFTLHFSLCTFHFALFILHFTFCLLPTAHWGGALGSLEPSAPRILDPFFPVI